MYGIAVRRRRCKRNDSGYMLLVLMIAVAVLTITLLGVANNYRRSILRDREVEMIHRGEQYERAIQRYYRKNGSYPISLEALENTNKVRYLRKRYKDPMSPDGEWKLVHATDIKLGVGGLVGAGAQTAGNPLQANTAATAASQFATAAAVQSSTNSANTNIFGNQQSTGTTDSGTSGGTSGGTTGGTTGTTGTGTDATNPTGAGSNGAGPVLGGGPILGVVSKSKVAGIHSFNDKSKYSEWFFIYDPSQDKGQQLRGPYNPNLTLGATSVNANGQQGSQTGSSVMGNAPGTTSPSSSAPTTPAPSTNTPQ